ncbi:protein of unknown function [Candidatus Methylocalor cossyra]|uniref:Uncharacterized protein n=1 Tax=Candidatus Methylocalor cossyra TaxID=3108543 RepID=A0ABP1CC91_9GAMM
MSIQVEVLIGQICVLRLTRLRYIKMGIAVFIQWGLKFKIDTLEITALNPLLETVGST